MWRDFGTSVFPFLQLGPGLIRIDVRIPYINRISDPVFWKNSYPDPVSPTIETELTHGYESPGTEITLELYNEIRICQIFFFFNLYH